MGNPPRGIKRTLFIIAATVVLVAIASAVVLSTRKSPYDKCEAEVRVGLTPGEVVFQDPCRGLAGSTGPPAAEMLVITLALACVIAGAGLVVKSGAKDEAEGGTRKSFPLNFAALWTTRMQR